MQESASKIVDQPKIQTIQDQDHQSLQELAPISEIEQSFYDFLNCNGV